MKKILYLLFIPIFCFGQTIEKHTNQFVYYKNGSFKDSIEVKSIRYDRLTSYPCTNCNGTVINYLDTLKINNEGSTWVKLGSVGTVTSVSIATANGISGSVANATSTPIITIIPDSVNKWATKNRLNDSLSLHRTAINSKQDTLISGTNIKTINSTSLLGSGNISIITTIDTTKTDALGYYATQHDIFQTRKITRDSLTNVRTSLNLKARTDIGNTFTGSQIITSDLSIGTASTGGNVDVAQGVGSEMFTSFSTGNWTLTSGWDATNGSNSNINHNANGTTTATLNTVSATIGTTYKVTIVVSAMAVSSFTYSFGGVTGQTLSAVATYTSYLTATSTAGLIVTPSNTSRGTINSISIIPITKGVLTITGENGGASISGLRLLNNTASTSSTLVQNSPFIEFGNSVWQSTSPISTPTTYRMGAVGTTGTSSTAINQFSLVSEKYNNGTYGDMLIHTHTGSGSSTLTYNGNGGITALTKINIGATTSPLLSLLGSGTTGLAQMFFYENTVTPKASISHYQSSHATTTLRNMVVINSVSGGIALNSNNTERIRLQSTGEFEVEGTNPIRLGGTGTGTDYTHSITGGAVTLSIIPRVDDVAAVKIKNAGSTVDILTANTTDNLININSQLTVAGTSQATLAINAGSGQTVTWTGINGTTSDTKSNVVLMQGTASTGGTTIRKSPAIRQVGRWWNGSTDRSGNIMYNVEGVPSTENYDLCFKGSSDGGTTFEKILSLRGTYGSTTGYLTMFHDEAHHLGTNGAFFGGTGTGTDYNTQIYSPSSNLLVCDPRVNSITHFQLRNSSGTPYFNGDATNGRIGFGGNVSPSYAVDVTGDVNVSGNFRVGGSILTSSITDSTGRWKVVANSIGPNYNSSAGRFFTKKTQKPTSSSGTDTLKYEGMYISTNIGSDPKGNTHLGVSNHYSLTSGLYNNSIGYVGQSALTTGGGNDNIGANGQAAITTGGQNVNTGYEGEKRLTTGTFNVNAGAFGLDNIVNGTYNTNLGYSGGTNLHGASSYNTYIGAGNKAKWTESYMLKIDNISDTISTFINGNTTTDTLRMNCDVNIGKGDNYVGFKGVWQRLAVGANVSSATTITPTALIFHVTGTTTITTINVPYTGWSGSITIIPDGLFTTTVGGNIALGTTAVVNKAITLTYDGTNWYPNQ